MEKEIILDRCEHGIMFSLGQQISMGDARRSLAPDFVRTVGPNGEWFIEGYASTDAVDSYNEVIDPQAFVEHLPRFLQFPIMLLNHAWGSMPIGKIVEAEVRQRGLWVRAELSKTADKIWTLIEESILKAFSVGFFGLMFEAPEDTSKPGIWRKIRLIEISVVNVPANPEALFSVAKSRGVDLSGLLNYQPITTKGGSVEFTLDQVREVVGTELKTLSPTIEAAASKSAEAAVKKATTPIEISIGDAVKQLQDIGAALAGCATKAELEAMKDTVTGTVSAIVKQNQRLNKRGLLDLREAETAQAPDFTVANFEKSIAEEFNCSQAQVRATIHKPEHISKSPYVQEATRQLQQGNDNLHLLDVLASACLGRNYRGPQTLRYFQEYSRLAQEFRKAMDTATATEGAEWIPTGFSAELQDRVELKLTVGSAFRVFPMPTNPYKWPVKSTRGTAYLQGESKDDSSAKYTASTPKTANVTFTAIKLAMRCLVSDEFVEDAIVPTLPFLQEDIVTTLAMGMDDAIMNGDTSTTHQDSDVTTATDVKKAFSGLRFKALANSGSKSDIGAVTVADLRTVWGLTGDFGGEPTTLMAWLCLREYITMLGDSTIAGVSNVGQAAALLTGSLFNLYKIKVDVSAFVRKTLNASGVYDNSTKTKSTLTLCHTPSFLRGSRRRMRVEVDKDIETGQIIVVGTVREDFQQMLPVNTTTGDYPVAIGYNAS